jgi:hypothetical protein
VDTIPHRFSDDQTGASPLRESRYSIRSSERRPLEALSLTQGDLRPGRNVVTDGLALRITGPPTGLSILAG